MMATPESIAAPIENRFGDSGLMDRYLDFIQGDATAQQVTGGDPLKKALRGISEFIPGISTALAERRGDKFGEALSYLDYLGPGGAGLKGASLFLLARKAELEKLIKAVDTDPLLKGSPGLKNSYTKELDEVNQKIASDAKLKTQADEMMADPSKFGIVDNVKSGERTTQNLNLDRPHNRLYHGSNAPGLDRGLGSLNLQGDAGALYMTREKSDPRLSGFAAFDKNSTGQGSVYTIKPTFDRTFDTPGVKGYDKPDEMEYIREYLKSKNKDQATRGLLGIKQAITPLKNYRIGTHVPPQVDKEFSDFFQDMGYDSLRFRGTNRSLDINPKTGYPYPDQSETIMSLNPEKSLEIMDEMSFSDYLKYLRDPNVPR